MLRRRLSASGRHERAPSSGYPLLALAVLSVLAIAAVAYFLGARGRESQPRREEAPSAPLPRVAMPPPSTEREREKPVPAEAAPAPAPARREPEPVAGKPPEIEPLSDVALKRVATSTAKERLSAFDHAQVEAMGEAGAREMYLALEEQALEELKLGRRACLWGKARGKSPEAQKRVFLRMVDAAHRANDASEAAFPDEIIAEAYAQEERIERATK